MQMSPDSGKRTREKLAAKANGFKNLMVDSLDDVKSAYTSELESLMNHGKSGIDSINNALKV